MRALASHQSGPGSILELGVICGLNLWVLYSALTGFYPGYSGFPLSSKAYISLVKEELLCKDLTNKAIIIIIIIIITNSHVSEKILVA